MKTIKILAIGTSSSRKSINLALAEYVAGLLENVEVESLSVADYELPLFSDEREVQLGQPALARQFMDKIAEADALVLSFAEYNGTYTASFKNIFDWASRMDAKVFQYKPSLFLSASPGPGGASSVLRQALESAEYYGAEVVAGISVPTFAQKFDMEARQMSDELLRERLTKEMDKLYQLILERRAIERGSRQPELSKSN